LALLPPFGTAPAVRRYARRLALHPAPLHTLGGILQHNSLRLQLVADTIGFGPVFLLARRVAGRNVEEEIGYVLVYDQNMTRHACVFRPNEEMLRALKERLHERFGFDERMTHGRIRTLYSRALERAFPALYPYVDPLVKPEDVARAREQVEADKAKRREKAQQKKEKGKAHGKNAKPDGQGSAEAPRRRRKQG